MRRHTLGGPGRHAARSGAGRHRAGRTAGAAAGRAIGSRPGEGRADPAAVGPRQCRPRRAVDEQRRRNGAGRIQEPEHPAPDQGRRRQRRQRAAGRASRRSRKAPRSSSGRCSRSRCRRSAQVARPRSIPVIAFSTDASVAARGVYLLSFLPESDVGRIVDYAVATGKRSFAGTDAGQCLWHGGGGGVPQAVARRGGRIVALERYSADQAQMQRSRSRSIAQAAQQRRRAVHSRRRRCRAAVVQALTQCRRQPQAPAIARHRSVGRSAHLQRRQRCRAASMRRRILPASRISRSATARATDQDPVRTATLAYDAVALVAALVKTQGAAALLRGGADQCVRLCRHRRHFPLQPDGTNERGLAVMRVDAVGRADRQPGAEVLRRLGNLRSSSREIGDHRIENRECRLRHAQMAVRAWSRPRLPRAGSRCASRSSGRPAIAA